MTEYAQHDLETINKRMQKQTQWSDLVHAFEAAGVLGQSASEVLKSYPDFWWVTLFFALHSVLMD